MFIKNKYRLAFDQTELERVADLELHIADRVGASGGCGARVTRQLGGKAHIADHLAHREVHDLVLFEALDGAVLVLVRGDGGGGGCGHSASRSSAARIDELCGHAAADHVIEHVVGGEESDEHALLAALLGVGAVGQQRVLLDEADLSGAASLLLLLFEALVAGHAKLHKVALEQRVLAGLEHAIAFAERELDKLTVLVVGVEYEPTDVCDARRRWRWR